MINLSPDLGRTYSNDKKKKSQADLRKVIQSY